MPCYHPIPAELEHVHGKAGKKRMRLHPKGQPTHWLPCGKCLGCREMQQQHLAIRMIHESKKAENKQFLTLTYNEEHCPDGLDKTDLQKFWKRLRKHQIQRNTKSNIPNQPIKYLACGEYGDRTQRPHYHAAVLNLAIDDQKKWDTENNRSETTEKIWGKGIVTISELTDDRIRYVAGYVLKKAGYRKQVYCTEDGEELQAPYRDMSKGLGKEWINKYATDLRNGYLQHEGAKYSIPRYYSDRIKSTNAQLNEYIEQQKAKNWKELTEEDRKLLHTGEKIRQKQIRDRRARDQI